MWEALFLILAIAAALVVLRLAKKRGWISCPAAEASGRFPRAETEKKDDNHLIVK